MFHAAGIRFPPPTTADATGLVAISAQMDADMLLAAYSQGLFPWADRPVRWYSPDPRAVFHLDHLTLPSNLPKLMRRGQFRCTYDQAFAEVMRGCASTHIADGEWITPTFLAAYGALHGRGHAHSVEVWQGDALVGGLYGVQIGGLFAGESMFHRVPNASKAAFHALVHQLRWQAVTLVDAQVLNAHTARLGARDMPRSMYLRRLKAALAQPTQGSGARWPTTLPPSAPPRSA
ncbi:MAG: leucyl/phenylalanyl-tRNA--protein transferase [Deltaproteobacteria bacterium]|nr:MAG: leucyl/phenylalanyl-tRNA--protein transferase [Deltaproteobacteria bacterium]